MKSKCYECRNHLEAVYSNNETEIHCIYGVSLCCDLVKCSHFKEKQKEDNKTKEMVKTGTHKEKQTSE